MEKLTEKPNIICCHCGAQIDDDPRAPAINRKLCQACGSDTRLISINVHGTITIHEILSLKDRPAGGGRPLMEQVVGDDFYRKTGTWRKLHRVIDRARNWYSKVVTDPKTGEILYKNEEPLSEHHRRKD